MSKLHFNFGTMGSGKSIDVLRVAHSYTEAGMRALLAKPRVDTKAGDSVESRIGPSRKVDILVPPEMNIEAEVLLRQERIGQINCLITDESQFFTEEQVDQLFNLAVTHSVAVVSFGLRTDFRTKSFRAAKDFLKLPMKLINKK